MAAAVSIEGAYLFQTRLEGVDLSDVTGLQQWQINLACGNDETILPPSVSRPKDWVCPEDE